MLAELAARGRRRARRRGTGRSTPSGSGPSGTPSTPPRCGRISSWSGCCTTGCSAPPSGSTASTFDAAHRPRRLPPGRPGLGGARRRRRADRPVPRRLLRPRGQARRRLDELVRRPVRLLGTRPVVFNILNIPRPPAGRADAAHPRRGPHPVPRVRPRPARAVLRRHLPAVRRHQRAARLRRVPEPGQRDVDAVAGGRWPTTPGTSRPASRCPPTWSTRSRAAEQWGEGFAHHRVPGRDAAGPGLAPARRRTP